MAGAAASRPGRPTVQRWPARRSPGHRSTGAWWAPAAAFALHLVEGRPLSRVEHGAHVDRRGVENRAQPEARSLPEGVDLCPSRGEDAVHRRALRRSEPEPVEGLARRRRRAVTRPVPPRPGTRPNAHPAAIPATKVSTSAAMAAARVRDMFIGSLPDRSPGRDRRPRARSDRAATRRSQPRPGRSARLRKTRAPHQSRYRPFRSRPRRPAPPPPPRAQATPRARG